MKKLLPVLSLIFALAMSLQSFGQTAVPQPVITSFSPERARIGDTVTLIGTGFIDVTSVKVFNVNTTSFRVVSPTEIKVPITTKSTTASRISVTTPGGTANSLYLFGYNWFPPTITDFTPKRAKAGDTITVTGTNFDENITAVMVGSKYRGGDGIPFKIISPTKITFIVQEIPLPRTDTITIAGGGGQAYADGFNFRPRPYVEIEPAFAWPGSEIGLGGWDLDAVTSVKIDNIEVPFTIVDPFVIRTTIPEEATKGVISISNDVATVVYSVRVFISRPVITGPVNSEIPVGSSVTLYAGIMLGYQWCRDGVVIPGATSETYTASLPGSYTVLNTYRNFNVSSLPTVLRIASNTNSFKVAATSATCKGSNNGAITITPGVTSTYTATITGPATNITQNFTSALNVPNLPVGTYNVCIDQLTQGYQKCFTVVVTEPKDLALYSTINKVNNTVDLVLTGANSYTIDLNGTKHTSTTGRITLALNKGQNDIVVTSDIPCQGAVQKRIRISDDISAYPNPFTTSLTLDLGKNVIGQAKVQIFNSFGKPVYSQQFNGRSGLVTLDLSALQPTQIYVLQLSADGNDYINKIIKK